jgi:hypothetical protein
VFVATPVELFALLVCAWSTLTLAAWWWLGRRARRLGAVLVRIGFEEQPSGFVLVDGGVRLEAPKLKGRADLEAVGIGMRRRVTRRLAGYGERGALGEPHFDERFCVWPAGHAWSFHGLTKEVREALVQLADLAEVRIDGGTIQLHGLDPQRIGESVPLLLQVARALRSPDLVGAVRTDPSDVVAADALRALAEHDRDLAVALAGDVVRGGHAWRRESARLRGDEEELSALLGEDPEPVRLLEGLDDEGRARVVAACTGAVEVLFALHRSAPRGTFGPALGRVAWDTLCQAAADPSTTARQRSLLEHLWPSVREQLREDDLEQLGRFALDASDQVLGAVLGDLVRLGGLDALPVLQQVEAGSSSVAGQRAATKWIAHLKAENPQARGGLSLADATGGALSVVEMAGPLEATEEVPGLSEPHSARRPMASGAPES